MEISPIRRTIQPLYNLSYVKFDKNDDGTIIPIAFDSYKTLVDEISKELATKLSDQILSFYEIENLGRCLTIQIDTNIKLSDRLKE